MSEGRCVETLKPESRICGEDIIVTGLRRMLVRRGSCDGSVVGSIAGHGDAMRRGPCAQMRGKLKLGSAMTRPLSAACVPDLAVRDYLQHA